MEDRMTFFQKFYKSLYSFKTYNYFLTENLGKGILYLLILVLFTTTLTSIALFFKVNNFKHQLDDMISTELGDFSITNGILTINKEMPINYSNTDIGINQLIIIDTEDLTDISVLNDADEGFILFSDRFYVKSDSTPMIQEILYSEIFTSDINSANLIDFISPFITLIVVIMIIFSPIVSFIGKILSLFIVMGVGGLIISSILKVKLSYSKLCTLGSYALTLPILLNTVYNLIDISIPGFFIIYYGIGLLYLFFGIKSISEETFENSDIIL